MGIFSVTLEAWNTVIHWNSILINFWNTFFPSMQVNEWGMPQYAYSIMLNTSHETLSIQQPFCSGKSTFTNELIKSKGFISESVFLFVHTESVLLSLDCNEINKKFERSNTTSCFILAWGFEICSHLQETSFILGKESYCRGKMDVNTGSLLAYKMTFLSLLWMT